MKINHIYNESNLVTMSNMPDEFVDLVVTSPPYDNLRTYKGNSEFDFNKTATELYRVLKTGGIAVWVVGDQCIDGNKTLTSFSQGLDFKKVGFKMYDVMIYQKLNPMPSPNRYFNAFEFMFILSKGKPKTINFLTEKTIQSGNKKYGDINRGKEGTPNYRARTRFVHEYKNRSNIWGYNVGNGSNSPANSLSAEHPATFPELLAFDHILSWSDRGDLVYDPFMGSGTTALMCVKAKRDYIGSEISKEYCEIIGRRLTTTGFLDFKY